MRRKLARLHESDGLYELGILTMPIGRHYGWRGLGQQQGTAGPVLSIYWDQPGDLCSYTSATGQVMPGTWTTFGGSEGCFPILHSSPVQAVSQGTALRSVPPGTPGYPVLPTTFGTMMVPGTGVNVPIASTPVTTTSTISYLPWIIGAAVVVVVILMMAR